MYLFSFPCPFTVNSCLLDLDDYTLKFDDSSFILIHLLQIVQSLLQNKKANGESSICFF